MKKQTTEPDYRPAWEQAAEPQTLGGHVINRIGTLIMVALYAAIIGAIGIVGLGVLSWSWRQL